MLKRFTRRQKTFARLSFGRILAPLGQCWVPFWRPLDCEGVPNKINRFRINQYKIRKNGVQEGVLEKHDLWIDSWCQNGRLWDTKNTISHYICCISVFREKASKNERQRGFQDVREIEPFGLLKGQILEFWGDCLRGLIFDESLIGKKLDNKLKNRDGNAKRMIVPHTTGPAEAFGVS